MRGRNLLPVHNDSGRVVTRFSPWQALEWGVISDVSPGQAHYPTPSPLLTVTAVTLAPL